MAVYRKSIGELGLAIGGVTLSEGGGDGEFLTITSPERGAGKGGVHGDVVLYDTPNSMYEVTIVLLETSDANAALQSLYNSQVSGGVAGTFDFVMEDVGTTEFLSGQCIFKKEPDREKVAEASNYTWELVVASPTPFEYSSRSVVVS